MENEETEFQNINTNNTSSSNSSETTSNTENELNNTTQNITVVVQDDNINEQLSLIHNDLGFICSFIIFFVLVVLLKYAYKFFDIFF